MVERSNMVECPFCDEVSKYEKLAKIGQGTFGQVFRAKHCQTGKKVVLLKSRNEELTDTNRVLSRSMHTRSQNQSPYIELIHTYSLNIHA
ncbi:cyclin-dependent kinase 9-like [Falco peregrinus]|uniref:cyclin-dependent kinase 9-like n=1 Tax=Falco peregrinus TaxID=8954 RepID=UPI00247A0D63|nr:cyclin-dependent kinase 9-like [Falco peregrinus]